MSRHAAPGKHQQHKGNKYTVGKIIIFAMLLGALPALIGIQQSPRMPSIEISVQIGTGNSNEE